MSCSSRINPSADSLEIALYKKLDSQQLSTKTARKMVGVANNDLNLSKVVGECIFLNGEIPPKYVH